MFKGDADRTAAALARVRRSIGPGDVELRWIASLQQAQDVQDLAIASLGATPIGYTMSATTAVTARLLNCPRPLVGKMLEEYVYRSEETVRLPYGILGVGAQLVFTIGSPLRDPVDRSSVSDAIASCRTGLQILGRRTADGVPLNEWTGTADFALDAGTVMGPEIGDGLTRCIEGDLTATLRIDGHTVAEGAGTGTVGDPLGALLALAQVLQVRGTALQAGDVVAAGSCTGLRQVVPGQFVAATFDGRDRVELQIV